VDTDTAGGTIYFLVSTGAPAAIEPSACVNFGQSITGFGTGTVNLGTWTENLFPSTTGYNRPYYLHVVHDPLDDGNLTTKVTSAFLATLNDNEMTAPASTERFFPAGETSISSTDPLITDWLDSGGNVTSDDRANLPAQLTAGQYTVTFSNPLSTSPNQQRTLTISAARGGKSGAVKTVSKVVTDGSGLTDNSEFWGVYKYGDYLFCAKGNSATGTDHGGIRVFDVSDVANGNAPLVFSDQTKSEDGLSDLLGNYFLRTVQVKGTPGQPGAEAYVIYRSSPYTAAGQQSMIYAYDVSDPLPANWALRSPWATSSDHNGGAGAPAYSVEMLSDMTYDGTHLYCSVQKSGLKKYDPADLSTPVAVNQNYTARQHETQGGTVDSDPSGYMYVAAYQNGVRIVPKSTLSDGRYSTITPLRDDQNTALRPWDAVLSKDENWLFLSIQSSDPTGTPSTSGLQVVDVHDPAKPQIVTTHILPVADQDIFNGRHDQACVRIQRFTYNTRDYVALGNLKKGLVFYDVTDPTRPNYLGTHTMSLQQAGSQPDGIGHSAVWEDGGVTYIAYGDYGSLTNEAGTKQLYIDELTLEGNMAFVIGVSDYLNAGTNTALNASNGTKTAGQDASHWHTASAGDYIDQVTIRIDAPGLRVTRFALYTVSGGVPDQFVNSWEVSSNSGETRDSYSTYPLGEQYALQDGVTYTIAAVRDDAASGGTNTGIISADPDVAFSGQNGTADGTAADGVFQNPYGGSPAAVDVIAMAFLGDSSGGGNGLKPPLAANSSIKLGTEQDKKEATIASGAPGTGADEVAIWAAASVDISRRQSVVGTFRSLHRYAQNNLGSLPATGPTILHVDVGGGNGQIEVDGTPTASQCRLEIGADIITNQESGRLAETFKQLEQVWLEASTGN